MLFQVTPSAARWRRWRQAGRPGSWGGIMDWLSLLSYCFVSVNSFCPIWVVKSVRVIRESWWLSRALIITFYSNQAHTDYYPGEGASAPLLWPWRAKTRRYYGKRQQVALKPHVCVVSHVYIFAVTLFVALDWGTSEVLWADFFKAAAPAVMVRISMANVKSNAISHIHSRLWCLAWYMDHIHNNEFRDRRVWTHNCRRIMLNKLCKGEQMSI